jgi:hypothetical protein
MEQLLQEVYAGRWRERAEQDRVGPFSNATRTLPITRCSALLLTFAGSPCRRR